MLDCRPIEVDSLFLPLAHPLGRSYTTGVARAAMCYVWISLFAGDWRVHRINPREGSEWPS